MADRPLIKDIQINYPNGDTFEADISASPENIYFDDENTYNLNDKLSEYTLQTRKINNQTLENDLILYWSGTKEEYELVKDQLPKGIIINITDDYEEGGGGGSAGSTVLLMQEYENVTTTGSDYIHGTYYLFRFKTSNKPWSARFTISTDINGGRGQMMRVDIGGFGQEIAYCQHNNIISDEDNLSAYSVVFAMNNYNQPNLVGLNIQNAYDEIHNIKVVIEYLDNCEVFFLEGEMNTQIETSYTVTQIDFRNTGIYGGNGAAELKGVLTIGTYKYDGSADVTIPVYSGN